MFDNLPARWSGSIEKITHQSLTQALDVAVRTLDHDTVRPSQNTLHKFLVTLSGGVGGAFGLPAPAVKLPVTTVIMLRSIADNARCGGEDIRSVDTKLACLSVFARGGCSEKDDGAESGYYAIRTLLAKKSRKRPDS